MDTSENLSLPYIMPSQAQKHVTHNEAIRMLDALVQLSVESTTLTTPPASPLSGERYIIAAGATGDWAGKEMQIAAWQDGAWAYFTALNGWVAHDKAENMLLSFDGSEWKAVGTGDELNDLDLVGVRTAADANNRLAVNSPGSLFSHDGSDHRLTLNKNAVADTASIVFQTDFSGRAEIGTTGDDNLHLKASGDGTNWVELLTASPSGVKISDGAPNFHVGPHQISTSFTNGVAALEISADIPGDRYAFLDFHSSDAQLDYSSRLIRNPGANGSLLIDNLGGGDIYLNNEGNHIVFATGLVPRLAIASTHMFPMTDNSMSLGYPTNRWTEIWAANGVIQTSDSRDKTIESQLDGDVAGQMIDGVDPILFRWKSGSSASEATRIDHEAMNPENPDSKFINVPKIESRETEGKRLHAGFLAQDIKKALDGAKMDFGAWGLDDLENPDSKQWIRPDQLLPILWSALKDARARIRALETAQ